MKIGVDAGALSITDNRLKLGVYWVNINLLRELGKLDKENTYFLYSFAPINREVMKSFGSRMINKVLQPEKGWFSLRLPLELAVHPVDIFLGLSQAVPHSMSYNIGFIYDLGFFHYPHAYPGSQKKLVNITDELVKRSDHIVTISRAVKDDILRHYGVNGKKITVAYPGVDETFKSQGQAYKDKHPYFLFVGALKRGKNIPTLLKAFAMFLRQTKRDMDLVLVGSDYWLDPQIEITMRELHLASHVKCFGFVSDQKLAALYRGAVAFVTSSLWEGFCLPAAEAMQCGCPVVYARRGSLSEIVGDAGIGFEPGNLTGEVNALISITHPKTRAILRARGKEQSAPFTWDRFARTIYRILSK